MALIERFAEKLNIKERGQLLWDMAQATVKTVSSDGSQIMFDILGYQRPPYQGQHTYGVEGVMLDSDGTELSVLLYADENDRLLELEFVRWGGNGFISPQWETLNVF